MRLASIIRVKVIGRYPVQCLQKRGNINGKNRAEQTLRPALKMVTLRNAKLAHLILILVLTLPTAIIQISQVHYEGTKTIPSCEFLRHFLDT